MTKSHIFEQFINDEELLKYIPTWDKPSGLTIELLLSKLAYIKREKYLALYAIYKSTKLQRSTIWARNYDIKVQPNFIENINEIYEHKLVHNLLILNIEMINIQSESIRKRNYLKVLKSEESKIISGMI